MNDYKPQIWVSHSSMNDFLKCPKLYYLRNVYRDPVTNHKLAIVNPAMALGQCVHSVLETLSLLPAEERFNISLLEKFEEAWKEIAGKKGGFNSIDEEQTYKDRGRAMLTRVMENPGIIKNKALRLKSPDDLPPRFLLSSEHNIFLCGKVDWLEYLPEDDSIHIVDFKTGKNEEDGSLQLAIYCLLVKNLKQRNVKKVSYWYLDRDNELSEIDIPDCEKAKERILEIALEIKKAREEKNFACARNGCFACIPFQSIIDKQAEYVGMTSYQDVYMINTSERKES